MSQGLPRPPLSATVSPAALSWMGPARALVTALDAEDRYGREVFMSAYEEGERLGTRTDDAISDEYERYGNVRCEAEEALIQVPAPTLREVLWKVTYGRQRWSEMEEWPPDWWEAVIADLQRFAEAHAETSGAAAIFDEIAARFRTALTILETPGGDEETTERAYLDALTAYDEAQPATWQQFGRKVVDMFDEASNPNEERKALLVRDAKALLVSEAVDRHLDLAAALDRHDAEGRAMNGRKLPDEVWEPWEREGDGLYDRVDALPIAPANAVIRARAILSMHCGELRLDEDSHDHRMLRDLVLCLAEAHHG